VNQDELILIERYYRNELGEPERLAFEQRMAEDAAFKEAVELHGKAIQAIRLYGRTEMKKRLENRPMVVVKNNSSRIVLLKWAAAIAVVAGLYWWFKPGAVPEVAPESHNAPTEPIHPDVVKAPEPVVPKVTPPSVVHHANPERLFASAFKPYKGESIVPGVRGVEDGKDPETLFVEQYFNGKYREALATFSRLEPDRQKNDNFLFIRANALLALKKPTEAAAVLDDIIKRGNYYEIGQVKWYRALAELGKGDVVGTKQMLQGIVAGADTTRQGESARLLESIR
jgi:hypothetical protein